MKRLCFLSPDIEHTRGVVAALKEKGIPEKHIYVVAKHGVELQDLPDAGPEADDFLAAYERGVAFGGAGGLLAGLIAVAFPVSGLVLGGGAVLLLTLYGAGLGGFLTGLAGAAFSSSRLKEFEAAIDGGQLLVMADVPNRRVAEYEKAITAADPSVTVTGIEPPAAILG
jgi:hypothetical protein